MDQVVLDDIISKLSFGATNDLPSDNWLTLPLLRSLNEGDLREEDILEAWGSTTKLSSNNASAPSKCLRFIEPSIRPLIASCMLKASREDWLRINLARRILVKAKKKVVNFYSDLRPISIQNALVSLYEKAIATRLMDFCIKKDIINHNCHGFYQGKSVTSATNNI
ncbi:hypothetical protein ACOME3_000015 [Neoechinorhynchus agilis]